jgi:hypothetical protein
MQIKELRHAYLEKMAIYTGQSASTPVRDIQQFVKVLSITENWIYVGLS